VSAYAEAVSDGAAGELRRRLFRAIWVQGLHLSSAYEVRRLVTGVMWRALERMRAPVTADRLDPFVEPSLCVARLTEHDDSGERRPATAGTR